MSRNDDTISRQAAIDAMAELQGRAYTKAELKGISKAWKRIKQLPPAQPEIIHCRDCKHRPVTTEEGVFYGFSVEFPDEKCPCCCEDGFYSWYQDDDFYCGYAERREGGE